MKVFDRFSRRTALGMLSVSPFVLSAKESSIPVGLEMFSVRAELAKDLPGTLAAVAKMGYEGVEFFAPYYQWTTAYAKQVRTQLDGLSIKCFSTHNGLASVSPDGLAKAIELNSILGSRYIVLASAGKTETADDWKRVAETLNKASANMQSAGLHTGYHNHAAEWKAVDGQVPMEILAKNTDKSVMLQLDVGTCLEAGSDPIAWIKENPGRIRSLHLKEWSRVDGYRSLFGEGSVPWKKLFAAAESSGGVEYYLIEQEGSRFPEFETAERCLVAYRNLHG